MHLRSILHHEAVVSVAVHYAPFARTPPFDAWMNTVARICIGLQRLGTGGTLLITSAPVSGMLDIVDSLRRHLGLTSTVVRELDVELVEREVRPSTRRNVQAVPPRAVHGGSSRTAMEKSPWSTAPDERVLARDVETGAVLGTRRGRQTASATPRPQHHDVEQRRPRLMPSPICVHRRVPRSVPVRDHRRERERGPTGRKDARGASSAAPRSFVPPESGLRTAWHKRWDQTEPPRHPTGTWQTPRTT